MLELQISQSLPSLPQIPETVASESVTWGWSGHLLSFDDVECLVLVEQNSGYAMLFFGLTQTDYQGLSGVWLRRLLAEALTVTELSGEAQELLYNYILNLNGQITAASAVSTQDSSRLAQISQGIKLLAQQYGALPQGESEEFRWGCVINQARQEQGQSVYKRFIHSCLSQLTQYYQPASASLH